MATQVAKVRVSSTLSKLRSLNESGKWSDIVSQMHKVKPDKLSVEVCNIALRAYGHLGMVKEIEDMGASMIKVNIPPGVIFHKYKLQAAAHRDPNAALTLLTNMEHKHNLDSYNIVIETLINNNRIQDANKVMQMMKDNGIEPDTGLQK